MDIFFASNLSLKNPNFRSARCGACHNLPTLTDHTMPFTFKAQLFQGRKQVAATTAKRHKLRKLKLTITRSETFFTAHVRGLVRGKLKFTIRAKKLGVSADPNTPAGSVTTQFTPSRKR